MKALERAIDALNAKLHPLRSFVLPGGTAAAAALHQARAVCRRAERAMVALTSIEGEEVGEAALDKCLGIGEIRRAVVEPVERRGGLDAGEGRALRVKAEIRRMVADAVPHRIDRVVEQAQREWRVVRQGQYRQSAAHRLAPRQQHLEPQSQSQ